MTAFTESTVEQAALAWLESVGWRIANGAEIAPGEPAAERGDYGQMVLEQRLRDALARLNPALSAEALEDAFRKLTRPEGAEPVGRNRALHRLLVDGVTVEYRTADGDIRGAQARVIDFDDPSDNDWLVVNQFSVMENKHTRRPSFSSSTACRWPCWRSRTRRTRTPRCGLRSSNSRPTRTRSHRCSRWLRRRGGTRGHAHRRARVVQALAHHRGERLADPHLPELQVVIEGLFAPRRFLDLVRDFIVFEDDGDGRVVKKMAGYHQFTRIERSRQRR